MYALPLGVGWGQGGKGGLGCLPWLDSHGLGVRATKQQWCVPCVSCDQEANSRESQGWGLGRREGRK